eukprot:TsM_001044400 transcript=TsM_001044400 gene=TsM_001044400
MNIRRGISGANNGPPSVELARLSDVDSTKSLAVKAKRHAAKRSSPLSPTNPVVYPTSFGALNISWDPPMSVSLISHYEVVLRNLTHSDDVGRRVCPWYKAVNPGPGVITRLVEPSQHPALHLTNMLPDTFYSVEVCALLHNGSRSAPALLPSSPLVPAAPPSGYPSQSYRSSTTENIFGMKMESRVDEGGPTCCRLLADARSGKQFLTVSHQTLLQRPLDPAWIHS